MKSLNLSKVMFAALAAIVIVGFQNCSNTGFGPDSSAVNFKSDADVGLNEVIPPEAMPDEMMPPDVIADMPDQEADEETTEEDIANGVTCIGNGIKVPDASVVACADGKPKCVQLCVNAASQVASFKEARSLIHNGALAGACP